MLKLIGKYKGIQPKKKGNGYLVGIEGEGFAIDVVHVKAEHVEDFKKFQKGQDVELPVYAFSFQGSDRVQYSYIQSF
ncbi:hypothetical protein [Caminicella sporogenes]|uniref:hypothetical protein n=1 Tax=Caminicella sporogenes TaxID=166485 RepID=UPI000E7166F6|nr:hypothetical protein [Caminicella sporogenes]RKD23750.1 hypothetical protein BET04_11950 [Caminicella sporogenes]